MVDDKTANLIFIVSLSNNIVRNRIQNISNDVKNIIISRISQMKFLQQLDESTDVAGLAMLMTFVRDTQESIRKKYDWFVDPFPVKSKQAALTAAEYEIIPAQTTLNERARSFGAGELCLPLAESESKAKHLSNRFPNIMFSYFIVFRHPVSEIELSAAFCYELQASGKSRPQRIPTSFDVPTSDGSLPKANQTIGLPLLRRTHGKGQLSVDMLNKLRDFSRKLTLFVSQFREGKRETPENDGEMSTRSNAESWLRKPTERKSNQVVPSAADKMTRHIQTKLGDYQVVQQILEDDSKRLIGIDGVPASPAPGGSHQFFSTPASRMLGQSSNEFKKPSSSSSHQHGPTSNSGRANNHYHPRSAPRGGFMKPADGKPPHGGRGGYSGQPNKHGVGSNDHRSNGGIVPPKGPPQGGGSGGGGGGNVLNSRLHITSRNLPRLSVTQHPSAGQRDSSSSQLGSAGQTEVENILKEMLIDTTPLTGIATPRKEIESKFVFNPDQKFFSFLFVIFPSSFVHYGDNLSMKSTIDNPETYSSVRMGQFLCDAFPIHCGLKQGDAPSPLLFNFALEYGIRKFQDNGQGLELNGLHQRFVYADDVSILGENPQTIKENPKIILEASKALGLEVNPENTKYMIMYCDQNIVRNGNIKIGDLSFEEVEKFKYLGATVTNINDTREEIKRRINMGNACYYSVGKLLSTSLLSKNLKVRIYKTVILLVALYGCET
ncbi:hypothetical protein ANN_13199 [Periplaneta americana]|uniref:Reverse transcriptase domain-containing protein n=1 Tax=Periplaneta americana TaxID=6978 RepID=A0ABQ8TIR5_PERAM|nr:hypothetical protein ANN_13199 [Periplaneta americana]